MTTDIKPLVAQKDFLVRLKEQICREGPRTFHEDEFCTSDPNDWPVNVNGAVTVRLAYPESKEKPSLRGITSFCDRYVAWYPKSGCSALNKDIIGGLDSAAKCPAAAELQDYINRILARFPRLDMDAGGARIRDEVVRAVQEMMAKHCGGASEKLVAVEKNLSQRCDIMFDTEADGTKVFNEKTADDLENFGDFCAGVTRAEQQRINNKIGEFNWRDFGWGVGTTAVIAVATFLWRVYTAARNAKRAVAAANKGVGDVTRDLRTFFGFNLPNLGRVVKYIFTGGWFKGKPLPEIKEPPPEKPTVPPDPADAKTPDSKDTAGTDSAGKVNGAGVAETSEPDEAIEKPSAANDETALPDLPEVKPHPDVVFAQLANLGDSQRPLLVQLGKRFASLSPLAQNYFAAHVIVLWEKESDESRERYARSDRRLTFGKVPFGFLLNVAREYLREGKMVKILEASAKVWAVQRQQLAEKGVEGLAGGILKSDTVDSMMTVVSFGNLSRDAVKRQLLSDARATILSEAAREYLVMKAIDRWKSVPPKAKLSIITAMDDPASGMLPENFMYKFRKSALQNVKNIEMRASAFMQITKRIPDLINFPFKLLDLRAALLNHMWSTLPDFLQEEFWHIDGESQDRSGFKKPLSFIDFMKVALKTRTTPHDRIERAAEPWTMEEAASSIYNGYELRFVMGALVKANAELAYYPEILEQRARTSIDAWLALPEAVRVVFIERDVEGSVPLMDGVSKSFLAYWSAAGSGVGTAARYDLMGDGVVSSGPRPHNNKKKGGGGKGSAGGGPARGVSKNGGKAEDPARSASAQQAATLREVAVEPDDSFVEDMDDFTGAVRVNGGAMLYRFPVGAGLRAGARAQPGPQPVFRQAVGAP